MDRCIDRYGRRALATLALLLDILVSVFRQHLESHVVLRLKQELATCRSRALYHALSFHWSHIFYLFLFMIHLGLKGRNCFPLALAQGSLRVVPGPYTMVVIKLGLATCKVSTTVLYICDPGQVYLKREFH